MRQRGRQDVGGRTMSDNAGELAERTIAEGGGGDRWLAMPGGSPIVVEGRRRLPSWRRVQRRHRLQTRER
jgi:hypothetical protein